jgi:hypothetical protein
MPITIEMLLNKSIYQEKSGTLAARIDFSWSIYTCNKEPKLLEQEALKKQALMFLTYALNIRDPRDVNGQLIELMAEREKVKKINPGYVPGKSPNRLPFNPAKVIPTQTPIQGINKSKQVNDAVKKKELLDVNDSSKALDVSQSTIFLTEQERAKRRVIISNGLFKQNGMNFDTSTMRSHDKEGFAAFTLNTNGELSVFVHNRMQDGFAHSSMNAGVPVVAAGEIKIENGVLKAITTHSGHYQPSLFNVYRLLEHFNNQGIDTSEAIVISFKNPSHSLSHVESKEVYYPAYHRCLYETPAHQIYSKMLEVINSSINSINDQVKTYKDGGFLTEIFKLKDKVMGSNLTDERHEIAVAFEKEINEFKQGLKPNLSAEELEVNKNQLTNIIEKYENENNLLSARNDKNQSSGRLSTTMSKFKEELKAMKESKSLEVEPENSASMKNIS